MNRRRFFGKLLGAAAVGTVVAELPSTTHVGVPALHYSAAQCPTCLNVLGLVIGSTPDDGPCYRVVASVAELIAGADVRCSCGTVVFVRPLHD